MPGTGFWWVILAVVLYGALHSILAANPVKTAARNWIGEAAFRRFYRLFFAVMGGVSFLPVLGVTALLPNQTIYTIPAPFSYLTLCLQALAIAGIGLGVMQTGALSFLGISQALSSGKNISPTPERLVVNGLYRWVRHPLYTFSLLLVWLTPSMTWNILALNLGVTAYLWIGSIFEERKLVEQFGKDYEAYRERTPRIIPGIKF